MACKNPEIEHWAGLQKWINEAEARGAAVILMGDLNTLWSTRVEDEQRSSGKYTAWDRKQSKALRRMARATAKTDLSGRRRKLISTLHQKVKRY